MKKTAKHVKNKILKNILKRNLKYIDNITSNYKRMLHIIKMTQQMQ